MKKVYSKLDPAKVLHLFYTQASSTSDGMQFLTGNDYPLQVAVAANLPEKYGFKGPHTHKIWKRTTERTSEAFIVCKGKLKVTMYDTDNSLIGSEILHPGDLYLYIEGGHAFEVLTNDTLFYEIKNGPYKDTITDKTFI